ncbi:F-box protein At5g03100-like [Actinidia eriantha]|uniref:F-box protein At5g03100-like n=1 Tax=Actinidia eriantha TaxID=165200 RepID=UPI00258FD3F5|nr:F-box protein At5g03100-like [Actinidia eriantha]
MKFLLGLCRKICSDGSKPNRRKAFEEENETLEEDRISALPDPLILHILSHLPMHEVIRTTMLSKRWNNLWIYVPSLTFTREEQCLSEEIVSFVTKTLALHRCSKIDKLSVSFWCEDVDYAADMDIWIDFAVKRKVEVLDLSFLCWQRPDAERYRLPEQLFVCSSVRELKLLSCVVEPTGSICWVSLKSLFIDYVKLTDGSLEKILSGCPVLEVLELCDVHNLNCLRITTPSLRKLVLSCSQINYGNHASLEIWAPYLQSLSISGFYHCKIRLLNASSLVDALLDFAFGTHEELRIVMWEMLEILHSVKNLTLGTWFIQALSLLGVTGLPSLLLKCRQLTLRIDFTICDLLGIPTLLQTLPYLEMLDIKMLVPSRYIFESYDLSGENYSTLQEMYSKCSLLHLKEIKISGFQGQNIGFQLELMQFLLKNARVLEKMIVYPGGGDCNPLSQCCMSQGLLQFTIKLLSYPRSSPHAVVMVCE